MSVTDAARCLWVSQLNSAGRQALHVSWDDPARAVRLGPATVSPVDGLLSGESISWLALASAFGVSPLALAPLIQKADEAFRERGQRSLNLVVGCVESENERLPLFTTPLRIAKKGKLVDDWLIEAESALGVCPVTASLLLADWGIESADWAQASTVADTSACMESLQISGAPIVDPSLAIVVQLNGWLDVARDVDEFVGLDDCSLVAAVAGDQLRRHELRATDASANVQSRVTILPADSSQMAVIERARLGRTLVVEGPPGTGKSQTITNLLAELVSDGQRVLFVAAKRTAVDVVLRRLAEAGLGDLVADLHDANNRLDVSAGAIRVSEAESQGDIEAPLLPLLSLSAKHHEAANDLIDGVTAVAARELSALPHIDRARVDELGRVSVAAAAAVRFASVLSDLRLADVVIEPKQLLTLMADNDSLRVLVSVLSRHPLRTATLRQLLAAAEPMRRLADFAPQLQGTAALPLGRDGSEFHRGLVTTEFRDLAIRRALATTAKSFIDQLEALGVLAGMRTIDDLKTLARLEDWNVLLAAQLALGASLDHLQTSRGDVCDMVLSHACVHLEAVTRALSAVGDAEWTVVRQLNESGLLESVVLDSDPAGFLCAMVTKSVLLSGAIATSNVLETEAMEGRSIIASLREAAIPALLTRQAARRMTEHADDDERMALQGLIRRARGRSLQARDAFQSAPTAMLARYPITVASPWSIARCLPATAELFDVVVFDEASQLEIAAAVPALARAKQAIVFGDSLQLPPTRFFSSEREDSTDSVLGQDSLLDAWATLLSGTAQAVTLRWHYRSRDERLIEFVNNHPDLYRGSLFVSPSIPTEESPIELVRLDSPLITALQERLDMVGSDTTVAVLTFGAELAASLSKLLRGPEAKNSDEPFVVRNIERFQGDERDLIFLVLPGADGMTSPLQSLGPINQMGGERRVNVALTRARERLVVLSSYGSDSLRDGTGRGANLLHDFLRSLEVSPTTAKPQARFSATTAFYDAVALRLNSGGLAAEVLPRRSAVSVRLTVRTTGRLLAVDFDDEASASLDPVDREIVRPQELDRRDWLRVRSTIGEWMNDSDAVVQRIRDAVQEEELQ